VLSNHIVSIVPAAAIGVVCGGLSIAFTVLNLKAARLRQRIVGVNFTTFFVCSFAWLWQLQCSYHHFLPFSIHTAAV
jgi:hypothetical protein